MKRLFDGVGLTGWSRVWCGLLLAAVVALAAGCESSGGSSGGSSKKVVGTWWISNGNHGWYITFNKDKSWQISDDAAGNERRVYGTYKVNGKTVRGPRTNPGVGTGEIVATVIEDTIALDFIEHWHTPYKTVHYSGNRMDL